MRTLTAAALAALPALPALPALAGDWDYRDWRVMTAEQDTGEDLRRTCTALTGGDGLPVLRLSVSNGDAGPPHDFPAAMLAEHAARHYPTQMRDGLPAAFIFDTGEVFYGQISGFLSDEGLAVAEAAPRWQDTLPVLRAMKASASVTITMLEAGSPGTTVATASLDGFTAAYGKMMDECGYSIELPPG